MPRRPAPCLLIVILAACGPGDPDHGSAGSSGDASSAGATDAVTSASEASSDAVTEPASSDAASTTGASDGTTQATQTSDASATGGAHDCGEQSCGGAAQVCVHPCCGGPAPGCTDVDSRGACANGEVPLPAEQCQFGGCTGQLCCPPVNCVPDPPFCTAVADLTCAGTSCSLAGCFGTLDAGAVDLYCECA
ncbi:hypothetical protein [Nannocystis sp.]|uniref:hypothetical protein n=1 Tax=Nannocystis sp. TaxID=1962667 RepID=UPI0025F1A7BF|nr:hypothetical protein [Nannocystis sp.]MBK7829472.1 hypothetical protein [Nannocystis sp.]